MKIYQDNKGLFKTIQNPTTHGGLVMGAETIVPAERTLPVKSPAHQPLRWMRPVAVSAKKTLAYVYFGGVIWWTEQHGKPSGGSVEYRNMWPVLREEFGIQNSEFGGLGGLVDRILQNKLGWWSGKYKAGDFTADMAAINTYLVRADNFFVYKDRAWWCDRFSLRGGKLTDGKNFKGTSTKVPGVPKQQDPSGDYNHINRVFIHDVGAGSPRPYQMLTEERRMKIKGLGANYQNYRCVINEYQSSDLEAWTFIRTLKEDATTDPVDHTRRVFSQFSGVPPITYKPKTFAHYKNGQLTNLTNKLQFARPLPGDGTIRTEGGKFRAYMNYSTIKYTFVSTDGLNWQTESTASVKTKSGMEAATALLIMPG